MSYYDDSDKVTYDKAHHLVEKYIREYRERRTQTDARAVARAMDVEPRHHNLIRINDALDSRLEVARKSGSKATRYYLE